MKMGILLGLFLLLGLNAPLASAGEEGTYAILTGFGPEDPYQAAADRLARHRGTPHVLAFDPQAPEGVLPKLREISPRWVAIVLRPGQIDVNSVRKILVMSTKVDEDPFVDFDFGYVTGATADEAEAFVGRIAAAAGRELPAKVGQVAVWGDDGPCQASDETYDAGSLSLPSRSLRFRKPKEGERDQAFIDRELKSLAGCGAILMGGHGMPWEIVSGPRAEDLAAVDLFPCVALNYACYTGATGTYPEDEFREGRKTTRLKAVETVRSFALAMLRRGAVGYVAYVNPRPAGPELTIDFERILSGETLGEVRRRDYDKIVLGYLGYGETGIAAPPVADGESMPLADLDTVRHMMLDAATGGILYGDPAYRPFPVRKDVLPIGSECRIEGDELRVRLTLAGRAAYLYGADPFKGLQKSEMALKLVDRVEVPPAFGAIRSVRVESATFGGRPLTTLPVVFAEEWDRGKRYLNLKVNFRRGGAGDIEVRLVAGPKELPPEIPPAEPEVVRAARAANDALLNDPGAAPPLVAKLAAFGADGFNAVLDLVREGEGHFRTAELFAATRFSRAAAELIRAAEGPDLPNYGTWIVLAGLGGFDRPEVRDYLLRRIEKERDPGKFMSAAQALGALHEERATAAVAKQLLSFSAGWEGVEPPLVYALAALGGMKALDDLLGFAADERAVRETAVVAALEHAARLDSGRAKIAAGAIAKTPRHGAFSEKARAAIARIAG